jgi:hypothetical protein
MTPTMDDILLAVERVTGVKPSQIKSNSVEYNAHRARLLTYFVASECFDIGATTIAKATDRTVNAVRRSVGRMRNTTLVSPESVDQVEEAVEWISKARAQGAIPINTREKADA